jgi:predicted  nucleic acid-binding Zn-ribbon protein
MADARKIKDLKNKIKILEERLVAVEKEQRNIREDILSGNPKERIKKRILEKPQKNIKDLKEELDKEIKIEI